MHRKRQGKLTLVMSTKVIVAAEPLGHHSTACVLLCLGPVPLYLDSLSDSCAPCMCASPWDPCPWFATSLCYSRAPCSRLTLTYPHLLIFCLHMLKICLLLQIRGLVLTTWSVDSMCCVHLCCTSQNSEAQLAPVQHV